MKEYVPVIGNLTYQLLPDGLGVLRKNLREIVGTVDAAMVQSYINLMNFRIGPMAGREGKAPPAFAFQRTIRKDNKYINSSVRKRVGQST